jgi:hypothetical protein
MLMRMRASRFGWCFAAVIAGCFSDAPTIGDDDDGTTSSATSPATTDGPTTSTPTSTSATSTSTATSTEPSTTSAPETGTSAGTSETMPGTSDVTSIDPTLSSSGTENCVTLDFDGDSIGCQKGVLALPIGGYQVTFTNAAGATSGVCIEHTADGDGDTSPLDGGYVWMQFVPNNPATLTFTAPVASVTMQVGPHHPEESVASIAICGTIADPCENATAVATQDEPSTMSMDLAGTTELFMYMNKGIGNIAIDDLEVCFVE